MSWPFHTHAALRRRREAHDRAHRGRLADAVAAEQAHALAARDAERHAEQHARQPVGGVDRRSTSSSGAHHGCSPSRRAAPRRRRGPPSGVPSAITRPWCSTAIRCGDGEHHLHVVLGEEQRQAALARRSARAARSTRASRWPTCRRSARRAAGARACRPARCRARAASGRRATAIAAGSLGLVERGRRRPAAPRPRRGRVAPPATRGRGRGRGARAARPARSRTRQLREDVGALERARPCPARQRSCGAMPVTSRPFKHARGRRRAGGGR